MWKSRAVTNAETAGGMGGDACHIPYNNAGLYEGADPSVERDEAGRAMVHSIQSSRKANVLVNDKVYSGIPHETCVSCHNRGKPIGVSFQGLMEFPYGSPYTDKGDKQPQLHSKFYQFIQDDVHHRLKSRPASTWIPSNATGAIPPGPPSATAATSSLFVLNIDGPRLIVSGRGPS